MRRCLLLVVSWSAALGLACGRISTPVASPTPSATVFTPAHASIGAAVRDVLGLRTTATQPIPFPHKTHVTTAQLTCTDTCHDSVVKSPVAGIPSVKTCMICHESIATDHALIQQVTAYATRKVEIPWQRVYGFPQASHVRFNHAPHIRAKVDCATCHGNVAGQTVAERVVDHTMGFCVDCHRARQAPLDCMTCHF